MTNVRTIQVLLVTADNAWASCIKEAIPGIGDSVKVVCAVTHVATPDKALQLLNAGRRFNIVIRDMRSSVSADHNGVGLEHDSLKAAHLLLMVDDAGNLESTTIVEDTSMALYGGAQVTDNPQSLSAALETVLKPSALTGGKQFLQ